MPKQTVTRIIEDLAQKGQMTEMGRDFLPYSYNIWHTQRYIGDTLGVDQKTVSNVIEVLTKNAQMSEIGKDFTPYIYNIWNTQKGNNQSWKYGWNLKVGKIKKG